MKIAESYSEFVEKITKAEMDMFNSAEGQELIHKLWEAKIKENPGLGVAEWEHTKREFMVFMFSEILKQQPDLMREFGEHIWNELQKEDNG